MTTPAHDAPLVLPSVAFRPVRLLLTCVLLTAAATITAGWFGRGMIGVFVGVGLFMGLLNAVLVQRSVAVITADVHPLKTKMALNSAFRLLVMTVVGLVIAYIFRPAGLGVVFGLALFQVLLVATTVLPVWKTLRTGAGQPPPAETGVAGSPTSDRIGCASDGTEGTGNDDV